MLNEVSAPRSGALTQSKDRWQAAEKLISAIPSPPQALKRGHILNDLAARVKLVPFPTPFELDFFRNL
jgi:hypothetical protein